MNNCKPTFTPFCKTVQFPLWGPLWCIVSERLCLESLERGKGQMFLSHIDVSLLLFHSPLPSL